MAQTSSIYDHFELYLTPMTLTFNLREKIFQMALLLLQENNCNIILKSMHKCTSNGPDHFDLYLIPVTLTFNLPSNGTSPRRGQTIVQNYFGNPCINVQVMALTSSIYDHFDLYLSPVTLNFNLPEKRFQMTLPLLKGNNCAKLF